MAIVTGPIIIERLYNLSSSYQCMTSIIASVENSNLKYACFSALKPTFLVFYELELVFPYCIQPGPN